MVSFFRSKEELGQLVTTAVANLQAPPKPEQTSQRSVVLPDPRQIRYDLLLSYGSTDETLAQSLVLEMKPEPAACAVLPSSRALFAASAIDFQELDRIVQQCDVAAVLLTNSDSQPDGGKQCQKA